MLAEVMVSGRVVMAGGEACVDDGRCCCLVDEDEEGVEEEGRVGGREENL